MSTLNSREPERQPPSFLSRSKEELNLFLLALGFFTRIPMPAGVRYSPEALNRCCRYFSAVGWLVGAILAVGLQLLEPWLGLSLAVLVTLAGSLWLTGVFHEDGLADTLDGLGGGLTPERKLEIMKDSRIGSYGAAGLCMALLIKWQALVALGDEAWLALLLAAALSRATSTVLMGGLPYVTEASQARSKPLVTAAHPVDLALAAAIAVVPLLWLSLSTAVWLGIALGALLWLLRRFYRDQVGGYTGDMLGAAQQGSELLVLLILVARGGVL